MCLQIQKEDLTGPKISKHCESTFGSAEPIWKQVQQEAGGPNHACVETAAELHRIANRHDKCWNLCDRSIWSSYITLLSAAQRGPKPPSGLDLLNAEPATECIESADADGDDSTCSRKWTCLCRSVQSHRSQMQLRSGSVVPVDIRHQRHQNGHKHHKH